jgi:hypothetical protein
MGLNTISKGTGGPWFNRPGRWGFRWNAVRWRRFGILVSCDDGRRR